LCGMRKFAHLRIRSNRSTFCRCIRARREETILTVVKTGSAGRGVGGADPRRRPRFAAPLFTEEKLA
jgi:hypothetical protein